MFTYVPLVYLVRGYDFLVLFELKAPEKCARTKIDDTRACWPNSSKPKKIKYKKQPVRRVEYCVSYVHLSSTQGKFPVSIS